MIKPKKNISKLWRPPPEVLDRSSYYRFEKNERTTLFSEEEFNNMLSELSPYDLVAYGELETFYNSVAGWLKLKRENILLTSGSDTAIRAVFETYICEDDEVLLTLPNYAMYYVYSLMQGANTIEHYYGKNLHLNTDELIKKISNDTKLIVISNPGHTGKVVLEHNLIKIIEVAKKYGSIVLIDEAYHYFYAGSMIKYIYDYDNLIVTRTFSKALGLASLRIGLLISNKEIICELYKVKLVHEISGIAAKIGSYFIKHFSIVDKYVNNVKRGKKILYKRIKSIGFDVYKSEANFVYFKLPPKVSPLKFKKYLERNRILIRGPLEKFPFESHFRITVGDQKQMDFFCDTLEQFINCH